METLRLSRETYHFVERGVKALEKIGRQLERFDILLRVNAEESRAVGVSGSQSTHRTTRPFGNG